MTSFFFASLLVLVVILGLSLSLVFTTRRSSQALLADLEEKNAFIQEYLSTYTEGLHQQEHFLSQIHHDVKGPLHNILVISELLQTGLHDETKITQLQVIHSSATRLNQQLQQALALSPHWQTQYLPQSGRLEPMNLEHWLREWISDFHQTPQAAVTQFHLESQLLLPYHASMGEPLQRMIEPILLNSTRGGRVRLTLMSSEPTKITLRVEDDGPGIPPALLPFVCYPFVKHPPHNQGHLGLGLYQTSRFALMLGAQVQLSNLEPHGLRVDLTWKR